MILHTIKDTYKEEKTLIPFYKYNTYPNKMVRVTIHTHVLQENIIGDTQT